MLGPSLTYGAAPPTEHPSHPFAPSSNRHTCLPGPSTKPLPFTSCSGTFLRASRASPTAILLSPRPAFPGGPTVPATKLLPLLRAARIHLSHWQTGWTPHSLLTPLRSIVRSSWANGAHLRVRLSGIHTIGVTSSACHHSRAEAGPSQRWSVP